MSWAIDGHQKCCLKRNIVLLTPGLQATLEQWPLRMTSDRNISGTNKWPCGHPGGGVTPCEAMRTFVYGIVTLPVLFRLPAPFISLTSIRRHCSIRTCVHSKMPLDMEARQTSPYLDRREEQDVSGPSPDRRRSKPVYIALYCVLLYTQSALQSCGGSLFNHLDDATVRWPHTSYRWRGERVIEPIKWMGIVRRPWLTRASGGNLARTPGYTPTL